MNDLRIEELTDLGYDNIQIIEYLDKNYDDIFNTDYGKHTEFILSCIKKAAVLELDDYENRIRNLVYTVYMMLLGNNSTNISNYLMDVECNFNLINANINDIKEYESYYVTEIVNRYIDDLYSMNNFMKVDKRYYTEIFDHINNKKEFFEILAKKLKDRYNNTPNDDIYDGVLWLKSISERSSNEE